MALAHGAAAVMLLTSWRGMQACGMMRHGDGGVSGLWAVAMPLCSVQCRLQRTTSQSQSLPLCTADHCISHWTTLVLITHTALVLSSAACMYTLRHVRGAFMTAVELSTRSAVCCSTTQPTAAAGEGTGGVGCAQGGCC